MKRIQQKLESLTKLPISDIGDALEYHDGTIHIGKKPSLIQLTDTGIKVGQFLLPFEKKDGCLEEDIDYTLHGLLGCSVYLPEQKARVRNVSLNHFGSCHNVESIDETVKKCVEEVRKSHLKIYEDPAEKEPNEAWIFIGDAESTDPMYELVLDETGTKKQHFQIDIDTGMSEEEVLDTFPSHFFDWQLDIQDIGTVLHMGTMYNSPSYDIRLGVGNNKRDKMAHRASMIELK